MAEPAFYDAVLLAYLILAPVVFVALLFIPAPYGRYTRTTFGPSIGRRLGWVLMELPAPVGLALWFVLGERSTNVVAIVLLAMWQAHYIYRAFVYPFRMRGGAKQMTVFAAILGGLFNVGNGYINGRWLFTLGPERSSEWLTHPAFLGGLTLFAAGMVINHMADATLRNLREPGETGYKVPRGHLFGVISCPNYLGEILQWAGWALASGSLAGVAFALFTAANLVPRALAHHRWYRENLDDYPEARRALVPFVL